MDPVLRAQLSAIKSVKLKVEFLPVTFAVCGAVSHLDSFCCTQRPSKLTREPKPKPKQSQTAGEPKFARDGIKAVAAIWPAELAESEGARRARGASGARWNKSASRELCDGCAARARARANSLDSFLEPWSQPRGDEIHVMLQFGLTFSSVSDYSYFDREVAYE